MQAEERVLTRFTSIFFLLCASSALATIRTVTCSGDITTAWQTALNSSVDGDEVSIGAGSCTISSMVTFTNKAVNLHGAGIGTTTITATHANTSLAAITTNYLKAGWRIHDFTLVDSATNPYSLTQIQFAYTTTIASGWRIDHVHFSPKASVAVITGISYGLLDHDVFDMSAGSGIALTFNGGMPTLDTTAPYRYAFGDGTLLGGTVSEQLPVNWGSANFIFVEDSTFINTSADIDSNGGARAVLRHNDMNGNLYNHWTEANAIYAARYEVYNNNIVCVDNSKNVSRLEAGTALIWGNTVTNCHNKVVIDENRGAGVDVRAHLGACDGSKAWDGNIEASGWPCLGQVGRGAGTPGSEASDPIWLWNNGPESTCRTGGACTNAVDMSVTNGFGVYIKPTAHTNGDVDYVLGGSTPKVGYTAYTYPHPLQGATTVAPTITTTSPLPNADINVAYSDQFTAAGDPATWSATSLPAGLTMSVGGLLSGTPTVAATTAIAVTATNAGGTDGPHNYNLTVNPPPAVPPTITTASPLAPACTVGLSCSFQFAATGDSPISFSGTGVPAGLTLSSTGLLSGIPTTAAGNTIQVTATNAANHDGPHGFSLTVNAAAPGGAPSSGAVVMSGMSIK
jgi:hypothetical protein